MGELYKCPVCKGIHASGGDCVKDTFEGYSRLVEDFKARIKQLEDEIVEWKLKYIAVCEKKDILEGK